MFDDLSFTHAIATAIISYGGFLSPPLWYKRFLNTVFGKLIALTILIYQAGGRLNILFSLLVAIIFYFVTEAMKRIHIYIKNNNDYYKKVTDNIYDKVIDVSQTTYDERVMGQNQ